MRYAPDYYVQNFDEPKSALCLQDTIYRCLDDERAPSFYQSPREHLHAHLDVKRNECEYSRAFWSVPFIE